MTLDVLLEAAVNAATEAGRILEQGFGTSFDIASKEGRHNLVTEYDLASENCIISVLQSYTPTAAILTEESGAHAGTGQLTWVIDPLDGTVNFAHGIPIFCVSIAAVIDGAVCAGVIHHPLLQETFTATAGGGAHLNGEPLHVSRTALLDDAILVTGFPYNVHENPSKCIDTFGSMLSLGIPVRRLGSAALDLAYVAAGRFDGYWEVELQPWDMAAGALMVHEAGGAVTHYRKRPFRVGRDSILATNGRIHQQLARVISQSHA